MIKKNPNKYSIILFLIMTSIFILLCGIYRFYELFYSSYFNQIEYTQIAFIGNEEMPTKSEILFSGFKDLQAIIVSSIISALIIYGKNLFLKRD